MRGKAISGFFGVSVQGITPAYAGKSKTIKKPHYHVLGSPPPMRGKGSQTAPVFQIIRITPAYAGKRFFRKSKKNIGKDHPRLCGEKPFQFCYLLRLLGSPPPMRGKAVSPISRLGSSRITPAYAGKSPPFRC